MCYGAFGAQNVVCYVEHTNMFCWCNTLTLHQGNRLAWRVQMPFCILAAMQDPDYVQRISLVFEIDHM